MSNKYNSVCQINTLSSEKMPGFVFQEILNHILQNPAYTIMHGAVANKKKKNKKK